MKGQTIFRQSPRPLGPKTVATITQLARFWYLLPEHVEKLNWNGKALTSAKQLLKELTDAGYADAFFLPKIKERPTGRHGYAYRLGPNALPLLRSWGEPVPKRLNTARVPADPLHINHTFACNDVLINAYLLGRAQETYRLTRFIHEKTLHTNPPRVRLPDGTTQGFELDGVLFFDSTEDGEEFEQILLLETDMGNKQAYWRKKLEKLWVYLHGQYRQDYAGNVFTFIVYTPTSETHLANLLAWTEAFLAEQGSEGHSFAPFFYFTNLPARTSMPVAFFLEHHWRQPFSSERTSPLEVGDG